MSRAGLVGGAGGGQVPGRHRHIPQLVVADRQVALPAGVGRVGGGQPGADVQAGLVGGAGGGQVPGRDRDIAELVVADRQVALPFGVGGVGGGPGLDLLVHGVQLPGGGRQVTRVAGGPGLPGRRSGSRLVRWAGSAGGSRPGRRRSARVPGRICVGLLGDVGDVVVAVQGGEVAGDVDQVVVAAALLLEPAEPHRQRPFMLGAQGRCRCCG